ncbi:hypothetical protein HF313_14985 [Massilia atriviolacea]|uniref:Uncharacterized protein n=1 Tax=Massilia atriviolacea TaxID=2495579 RepID=A0A430HR75_9BURK|nr:hypothetical protein [Massilia atriviolacea]RSZ60016.1 hypothetical protein EJB06_07505 [Massilia atriviolacea]
MKLLSERLAFIYKETPELEGERGQTGLIKASGASKSVVNQWLNDKIKSIDIRYALNIERELGFSHIWLMTGDGDPHEPPAAFLKGNRPWHSAARAEAAEEARITLDEALTAKCGTAEEQQLLTAYRLTDEEGRIAFRATMKNVLIRTEVTRNKAQ